MRMEKKFEEMKREISDQNETAKVIVHIGANHNGECETETGIYVYKGKWRSLGYCLDRYTKEKNFSVYTGTHLRHARGVRPFHQLFYPGHVSQREKLSRIHKMAKPGVSAVLANRMVLTLP